jgi:major membrane immunogen (membrane-anchored lipoprotein)
MKPALVAALLLLLSACSDWGPPHSDYFVVTFAAGRAELPPDGRQALSYATRDADRGAPRAVVVKAYVRADGSERALAEQRMKVIADALVEAGVARNIIRVVPQPAVDDAEFARLGNGAVVQIERGEPAAPPAGSSEAE